MKHISGILVLTLILGVLLQSCKKDNPDSNEVNITFQFEHVVGNDFVEFNNIQYVNAFGNTYSVETLKYFISDFRVQCACGSEVFFDEEHYVDGSDEGTLSFTPSNKLPEGNYSSVSFVFGLNEAKNVDGRFPDPPENNMEWPPPLGGGYHYMKLEGKLDSAGTINNFQAHTGPTNGNPNFIELTLPSSDFTVMGSDLVLTIRMDINSWWVNPNTFDLNEMTMVMGNQAVQQQLRDNGNDVFSLGPVY